MPGPEDTSQGIAGDVPARIKILALASLALSVAVRTRGLRKGLALTLRRIHSCQVDVPLGTVDPVPPAIE